MMRIGIEASAAVGSTRTGVGTYAGQLIGGLQRLAERRGDIDLLCFSNRFGDESLVPSERIYPHDHLPSRQLWLQAGLPRSLARTRPDVCHFPNYLAPARGIEAPYLVTMHDMSIYRYPQHLPLKTIAIHRALVPLVGRRARVIVTTSESARQDVLHYLRLPEDRVRVVYSGIDRRFQRPVDEETATEVRARYGLHFPYLLTVCTLEPRKNHARLIEAFELLVRQEELPHHLVVTGAQGWKHRPLRRKLATSPVADRIHYLGYVPSAHLPALYQGAAAFAFPSLYEGFGFPVLEALASGAPTLISQDPALTEIAGEATAVVANPYSSEDIAAGLYRLLTDRFSTARLRANGFARADQFSWDRCAEETFQLYEEAIGAQTRAVQFSLAR